MNEPTPKPWVASKPCSGEFYEDEWYVDRAGQDVASVAIVNGEANARLIIAAPEMLEACEFALRNFGPMPVRARARLEAAIAKAKGDRRIFDDGTVTADVIATRVVAKPAPEAHVHSNAHRAAAAPEMEAVLERIANDGRLAFDPGWCAELRAALAKAKGE